MAEQLWLGPVARRVERLAAERWKGTKPTILIGLDERLGDALEKIARFAASDAPVLITGETGTGKELFARALFLLGDRRQRQFLSINCAQYHDSQLIASELFGHRRGAFTGAIADHSGMFEDADGGVVFLDEVGELSLAAQSMLLRVLGEGEIVPVGSTKARSVDVRVVAATSRDLVPMVESGAFRADLYYRLCCLRVVVPPVRDRGDDWRLIAGYYLDQLIAKRGRESSLSFDSFALLAQYDWPGNVRELKSAIDTGFHLSEGSVIEPRHFADELQHTARVEIGRIPAVLRETAVTTALHRMLSEGASFWDVIHKPYLARELTRAEVRLVIEQGLTKSRGSYKALVRLFNIPAGDYVKFMDFLRHQRLKPEAA